MEDGISREELVLSSGDATSMSTQPATEVPLPVIVPVITAQPVERTTGDPVSGIATALPLDDDDLTTTQGVALELAETPAQIPSQESGQSLTQESLRFQGDEAAPLAESTALVAEAMIEAVPEAVPAAPVEELAEYSNDEKEQEPAPPLVELSAPVAALDAAADASEAPVALEEEPALFTEPAQPTTEEPEALVDTQGAAEFLAAQVMAESKVTRAAASPRLVARAPLPQARSLAIWLLVVRPHALLFAVTPVVVAVATLAAQGARVTWSLAAAAVLAIGLAQAGCSAIDAYREHQRRQRALRRGDSAVARTPSPLLTRGIYPLDALRAGCAFLAFAGIATVPLVVAGGVPVLALVVCGAAAGLLYSVSPYPLKFYPIGDVLLFAGLGPGIVIMVALTQRQRVSPLLLVLGVVLGLYMLASVFAAHLRDAARLRAMGRLTLAGLLGERQVRLVCVACVAVPYLAVLALGLPLAGPHPLLLALLSLPAAVMAVTGVVRAVPGEPQALVVRQLGRAYLLYAAWLVVGLAVMAFWINLP